MTRFLVEAVLILLLVAISIWIWEKTHDLRERWFGWARGWRSVLVAVILGSIPLLDGLGAIDLRELLEPVFGHHAAAAVVAIMTILIVFLRWLTTTPMFVKPVDVAPPPSGIGPAMSIKKLEGER